jgi:curved DNA-binding protein CbpA
MLIAMADKVPRLLPGVDIRTFKLDPTDGFLLTRIDGKLGPRELARETGLPDFSVSRALEKLEKLAIIEVVDPNAPPAPPPLPPPPERKSAIAQFEGALLAPKYDPAELDEVTDLPPEQKKRVLDFYYRLDDLDHYTLLGVARVADKKAIKRAYFELASIFHPDRYYKKNLGTFKVKMEVLFARVTEAHDTLVDVAKRADYDGYLADVATTRGMEAMLERAMVESAQAQTAAQAQAAAQTQPQAESAAALEPPPPSAGEVAAAASAAAAAAEEERKKRRQLLAMRLTGGRSPSRPGSIPDAAPKPNPHQYQNTQDAMDALKRRYEDRIESATLAQAQRYIQIGEEALARNDLLAASTAFNVATKFAPDDANLAIRAQEIKGLANKTLAESYLKQGSYEERSGRWAEAARSWSKVASLRGEPTDHERAANALLRSDDGDLHDAADHAKRAIELQPDRIENHVTLVEVYLKAGLSTSARRAAEAALQLDPKHPGLLTLLKRAGKS